MSQKIIKRRNLLIVFVFTLIFASLAVALPSFAESSQVEALIGKLFSASAETEKSPVKSEISTVEPLPSSLLSSPSCVVRDDFNRANSTNMGANWTETSGNFSILSNRTVGTNNSVMNFTGATSGDTACVDVYAAASGTQFGGIYLKWTSSSDNLFVKVQDNDGSGDFDRIFFVRDSGFVFNQACQGGIGISSPFTSARLSVYLDGTTLKADIDTNFDNTPDQSYSCADAPAKTGTGVALGIFGAAALDNFGTPPNTLTVTKTADTNDGTCDADCSLREAIAAAVPGDIIEFASPLFDSPQEIQLSGQLLITKNLTINGKGAKLLTLRQMSAGSRIIQIQNVTTVNLSGMTITGGNIGFDNGAGILASYSNFPFPPGLTLNFSGLNITGNSCGGGGCGISAGNYNLNLSGSTVSNNSSSYCCGQGGVGGIQFTGANTFNLINSTVSGNTSGNNNFTAGGGIWSIGSTLNVINSTITDNGANGGSSGVNVGGGTMTVRNSIIAGNRNNTNTPDVTKTVSSSIVSHGNNIIGNAPGTGFTDGVNNDRVGNSTTPFNPLLGTLADNGGSTPTHALLANSQAINNGNNCVTDLSCAANNPPFALTTDQRGVARVGNVDIGAFEAQDSTPPVITPTVTGTLGNNGWYVSDVQVSWSVSDDESTVTNQTGCDTQTVTTDTAGITFTCSATSAGGTNAQSITIKRDTAAPTVELTSTAPNPTNAAITVTVQFNEPVTGFDPSDITVANGTPSNLAGSGSVYTFTVTPAAPGTVSAQVQANAAQDEAGNQSSASNQLTRQFNNLSTLTVTKTTDTNDGVCSLSDCSLREAVAVANQSAGAVTIDFASALAGQQVTLSSGWNDANDASALRIFGNITIQGMTSGAGITIAMADGVQKRHILVEGSGSLTVTNLTFRGGYAGDYGGSIWSFGTLTVRGCTFTGNYAGGEGGAVQAWGGLSPATLIENSTFSGNTSGGIAGAIDLGSSQITIRNVTITNNSSAVSSGALVIYQTQAVMTNTIVAGNTGGDAAPANGGAFDPASAHNLIGTGGGINLQNGVNNNQVGVANARLGALVNNGGPTPTAALLPGSPAINAGTSQDAPASDQRGKARVAQVDIGAFEAPANLVVTNTNDSGAGSLRDAIAAANASAADESISFAIPADDGGCANGVCTITLGGTQLTINSAATAGTLTISNTNGTAANLLVSGNNASRVFNVVSGANLTLDNLTVTGGTITGSNSFGGGISIFNGTLTLTNSSVSNNVVTGGTNSSSRGGGILNQFGTLNIMGSTVSNNSAVGTISNGGGIYIQDGTLNIVNSAVSNNSASDGSNENYGGGMYFRGATVNIAGSTVSNNSVAGSGRNQGGGIFILDSISRLNLTNSTVSNNSAIGGTSNSGGGINSSSSSIINARNTIISGNTAVNSPDFNNLLSVNDSNLIGNAAQVRLAPLGFYGGGTMTHALLSGSTAINTGNNCVVTQTCTGFNAPVALTADQRGAARVGAVDIGAFELNNSANSGNFKVVLPNGTQFFPYQTVLVPNNGTFDYSVTGGALPVGINLTTTFAPDAVIALSGTPSESGIFNFSITATDGANFNTTDFTMEVFGPTSAQVEIAGRVLTKAGSGIRNARISMTAQDGSIRYMMTNMFGYYRFTNVEVGETYILTVVSKQYIFAPQVVSITENVSGLNFIPLAEN